MLYFTEEFINALELITNLARDNILEDWIISKDEELEKEQQKQINSINIIDKFISTMYISFDSK